MGAGRWLTGSPPGWTSLRRTPPPWCAPADVSPSRPRWPNDSTVGRVSFDRAVELARWAVTAPSVDVIGEHWRFDITGLRRQIARQRQVAGKDEQQTVREQHVVLQPDLERSRWRLWGELDGSAGAIVEHALQQRADELPTAPLGAPNSRSHRMALALTTLCQDANGAAREDRSQPLVTVVRTASEAAPSNGEIGVTLTSGPRVGPQALEAILCQGKIEVTAVTAEGTPMSIGPARVRSRPGCADSSSPATGNAPPRGAPAATGSKSTTAPRDPLAAPTTPRTSPASVGTTTKWSSTATDTTSTPPAHQGDSVTRRLLGIRPDAAWSWS